MSWRNSRSDPSFTKLLSDIVSGGNVSSVKAAGFGAVLLRRGMRLRRVRGFVPVMIRKFSNRGKSGTGTFVRQIALLTYINNLYIAIIDHKAACDRSMNEARV